MLRAHPKPCEIKRKPEAVKRIEDPAAFDGYREVCEDNSLGKAEYWRRTLEVWRRNDHRCALVCGKTIPPYKGMLTADHIIPRGNGGMNRDDRVEGINGSKHTAIQPACMQCNGERGSKRL